MNMGIFAFLISSLFGAGLMYFLDPQTGKTRRTEMQDQLKKLQTTTSKQVVSRIEILTEDVATKARDAVAGTVRQFKPEEITDETLAARIRSEMERFVSHPGAVNVAVERGIVTLSGDILSQELQPFIARVKSILGVRGVENRMQVRSETGNIPNPTSANGT
jgi:osmotically-inducible protein OsmY